MTDAKTVLEKYEDMEFNIRNSTRPEVSAAELALIETRAALAASEARVKAWESFRQACFTYGYESNGARMAYQAALAAGDESQVHREVKHD